MYISSFCILRESCFTILSYLSSGPNLDGNFYRNDTHSHVVAVDLLLCNAHTTIDVQHDKMHCSKIKQYTLGFSKFNEVTPTKSTYEATHKTHRYFLWNNLSCVFHLKKKTQQTTNNMELTQYYYFTWL